MEVLVQKRVTFFAAKIEGDLQERSRIGLIRKTKPYVF
jgi:hypothetical protein